MNKKKICKGCNIEFSRNDYEIHRLNIIKGLRK